MCVKDMDLGIRRMLKVDKFGRGSAREETWRRRSIKLECEWTLLEIWRRAATRYILK